MAALTKTVYKVIYFTDNNVIQCRTFDTQTGASDFADTLPTNKWRVIVSYVTSQNVTTIT